MSSLDTIKKQIDNAQNGDLENQINCIADAYKNLDRKQNDQDDYYYATQISGKFSFIFGRELRSRSLVLTAEVEVVSHLCQNQ